MSSSLKLTRVEREEKRGATHYGFSERFSGYGVEPPRNRAVFDEDASAGARKAPPGMDGEGGGCGKSSTNPRL